MRRALRLAALAPALAACGSPSPLEREFDPDAAMRVEVFDDSLSVDGRPVARGELPAAVDDAHRRHGKGTRRAALVIVRLSVRSGENEFDFEMRSRNRKTQVLDELFEAGIRDIQFGPPAPPPKAESKPDR